MRHFLRQAENDFVFGSWLVGDGFSDNFNATIFCFEQRFDRQIGLRCSRRLLLFNRVKIESTAVRIRLFWQDFDLIQ